MLGRAAQTDSTGCDGSTLIVGMAVAVANLLILRTTPTESAGPSRC